MNYFFSALGVLKWDKKQAKTLGFKPFSAKFLGFKIVQKMGVEPT